MGGRSGQRQQGRTRRSVLQSNRHQKHDASQLTLNNYLVALSHGQVPEVPGGSNVPCDGTVGHNLVDDIQIKQAQGIISKAFRKDIPEQKKAIDEAIQLLYPYAPREGQRDALHQLIYLRRVLFS
jgi:hypothetical protein